MPSLVVGDFNVNAHETTVLSGVDQFVTKTTHVDGAILDHVYWSGRPECITTDVVACHWSDHNTVVVSLGENISDLSDVNGHQQIPQSRVQPSASVCRSQLSSDRIQVMRHGGVHQARTEPLPNALDSQRSSHRIQEDPSALPAPVKTHWRQQRARSTVERVSMACTFLDGALGPQVMQMDISVPITDFINQYKLNIRKARGDGHCLLYAWANATNVSIREVKQQLIVEFNVNQENYIQAGIQLQELQRYIQDRTYTLDSVDAVLEMLTNAFHKTAFIVGQKYDYTYARNIVPVPGVTEIRRIEHYHCQTFDRHILLLKSGDHYDGLR